MSAARILEGDCLAVLPTLPAGSVQTCITSPPYYGLRDYGTDGQIGLEETPEQYVANLVAVFREVRRVLRDDGTLWLNLGDSYAVNGGARAYGSTDGATGRGDAPGDLRRAPTGYKPKDLLGIPWMVAFALRADGWYLRSDIIWAKPNPMPESVTDRPTKAHEYLFILSKSARYFWDADAVREKGKDWSSGGPGTGIAPTTHYHPDNGGNEGLSSLAQRYKDGEQSAGRNIRSVWTVATQPFPGAHFATFPPKLIEPCVLAGSSPQACAECGAPWERVTDGGESTYEQRKALGYDQPQNMVVGGHPGHHNGIHPPGMSHDVTPASRRTVGWQPTCDHSDGFQPGDFEVVETPTGERAGDDPSLRTGRAGMNRPRHPEEGRRPITRYEQRHYADQLRASPARQEMEREAGTAFAHYIRTDRSGARPIPGDLLEAWIARDLLERVEPPRRPEPDGSARCTVLDPFSGAGTTGVVALRHDRDYIGIELNAGYAQMARYRIADDAPLLNEVA